MNIKTQSSQYRDDEKKKKKKFETAVNAACQGILSAGYFGHACYKFAIPPLVDEGRWPSGKGLVAVIC
jgi:hypothetical protein